MAQWKTCRCCGRRFLPDRFNRHRHECCTHPDCVRERKCERQRASYRRQYRGNATFRKREQERAVAGGMRRRREARASPPAFPAGALSLSSSEVLAGLVAQVCDSRNAAELTAALAGYAERGRRCAAGAAAGVSPPGA